MAKAQSVEDVVLGEAKAGNYADMVAIASVIENRSRQLGVTYEQVVQDQREFNAYNKALPPGVNQFRDLARKAIEQVQTQGPVHRAKFYATPSATKGLPKGLSYVTETAGHQFFEDPQNRAIRTSVGFRQPNTEPLNVAGQPANTLYDVANPPTPEARPDPGLLSAPTSQAPRGLAGLSPSFNPGAQTTMANTSAGAISRNSPSMDLEDRPLSQVIDVSSYNPAAGRSQMPTSAITRDIQASVTRNFGPEFSVGVYSGMEPAGSRARGSARNHPGGFAADFDVVSPDGKRLDMSNPAHASALREVQKDLAAKGHAIGYGAGYMAPGRTHAGSPPGSGVVGWGSDRTRATMDPGLYGDLANAKATGVNLPDVGPMPGTRASTVERAMLGGPPATITGAMSMPTQGPSFGQPPAPPAVDMAAMASQYGQYRSPTPPTVEQQINAMTPAISMPGTLPSVPSAVPVAPPPAAVPMPAPRPAPMPRPAPIVQPPAPVIAPPAPMQRQQVAAPQAARQAPPTPSFTGQDVWSGKAQSGIATNGNQMTRNPDGTVSMTSARYGYTDTMNPDGSYRSTTAPGLFGLDAAANRAFGSIGQQGIQGPLGQPGIQPQAPASQPGQSRLGQGFRGAAGSVAGSMIGGLLGPVGALLGGYVASQMAQGKNPLGGILSGNGRFTDFAGNRMPTPSRAQQTFQQGYTPGLAFPDRPQGAGSQGGLTSFGEAAARGEYGGQARDAANNPGRGLY